MSGGHFGYNQNRIRESASEVENLIAENDNEELDRLGYKIGYGFRPEVIEKFKEAAHTLHQAAEMLQRVDWLVCGDDGEDSFLERWEKEVRPDFKKYFYRYLGDGMKVKVATCSKCGVAPASVDDCGCFGDSTCPYFGKDGKE